MIECKCFLFVDAYDDEELNRKPIVSDLVFDLNEVRAITNYVNDDREITKDSMIYTDTDTFIVDIPYGVMKILLANRHYTHLQDGIINWQQAVDIIKN